MEHVVQQGEKYRRGAPVLSSRLQAAAAFVRQGSRAADIGCDHGKLAVWLALRRGCEKVVAVDNRALPLQRARALVSQTGCEALVDCRLGDGLAPIAANEVTDIVIAGMSGETIAHILGQAAWLKQPEINLVLLPVTRDVPLRAFLLGQGFALAESCVEDSGRPYIIMTAKFTGVRIDMDEIRLNFGPAADGEGGAAKAFARRRLKDLYNQRKAPLDLAGRERLERLIAGGERCCR